MKKEYSKPLVLIENYYLSEMIAGCEEVVVWTTTNNVNVTDALNSLKNDFGLFTSSCTIPVAAASEDMFASVGLCHHTYNGPSQSTSYNFNS